MLKYQACLAFQHWDIRTFLGGKKKKKNVSSYRGSSEWWNKELCMKWIESVKQTGNLPSDGGGFFISYSHFHGSCFERGLKIIIPLLKH